MGMKPLGQCVFAFYILVSLEFASNQTHGQLETSNKTEEREVIRVTTFNDGIFVSAGKDAAIGDIVRFGGVFGNYYQILSEQLQMDCVLVSRKYHSKKVNGTWTGAVGELQRNETDVSIGLVDRQEMAVIDFSFPLTYDELRFIVRRPKQITKAFIIAMPFNPRLWAGIFASILIGSPILYFLTSMEYKLRLHKFLNFHHVFWLLSASYSGQDQENQREHLRHLLLCFKDQPPGDPIVQNIGRASRWMVSTWWIAVMIIIACYGGMLMSFATHPGREFVPRTFPQLVRAVRDDLFLVGTIANSISHSIIKKSKDNDMMVLKKSMDKHPEMMGSSIVTLLPMISKGNYAIIMFKIAVELVASVIIPGEYVMSKDDIMPCAIAFRMRNDYPHKKVLNKIARASFENGLLKKWKRDHFLKIPKPDEKDESPQPLSMYDVQSAFYLLFLGQICGCLCLFVEMAWGWQQRRSKKKKHLKRSVQCKKCGGQMFPALTGSYEREFLRKNQLLPVPNQ